MDPEHDTQWLHCKKCGVLSSHYPVRNQLTGNVKDETNWICSICGVRNKPFKLSRRTTDAEWRARLEQHGQQRLIDND
jgi:RNase P subunit RPR2